MAKELILEIGTEEVPARFTPKALEDLSGLVKRELGALEIVFGKIQTMGTPRRLVLCVDDVGEFQKDAVETKLGPPKHLAFDEKGNPTKAARGFAKTQGIPVEDLETVTTERGEYLGVLRRQKGRKTRDVLTERLPQIVTSIPFLKSMRWGSSDLRFVRPIHWILAFFGGEVLPFRLDNIESGDMTYGHRFMSPGAIKVRGFADYLKKLRKASVIVDPAERKRMIERGIEESAGRVSGTTLKNQQLLEEVTYLVEFPTVILGDFEKDFLSLPKEVIVHAMEDHQRYFPVMDAQGNILPHFVCVCNTQADDMAVVKRGNERVLRARLSDGRFFFNEDMKVSLEQRIDDLKEVVFQAKLGTSYDKVMRFRSLSLFLTRKLSPEVEPSVDRAAFLCKADLVTGMVGEFPGLQGIIDAIYEHYLPAFAGDRLPSSPVGDFISIADKMDTIVGCFGVGLIPTGAGDPFALRRQALGVLNIVLEKGYPISLGELVGQSLELLKDRLERPPQEVKRSVLEFLRQRFQNLFISKGFPQDVVEAVVEVDFDNVADCEKRITALNRVKGSKEFVPLAVAFKRVVNISRDHSVRDVSPSLFQEDAERELHTRYLEVRERGDDLLRTGDYRKALARLTHLKKPVDQFFDGVLVMDKEERIRNNRLALLGQIADLFSRIADFSRIATE
jgi:glycyl-tRNA synthetase beta chain